MTVLMEIESILLENKWVIVEGYKDEPVNRIIESYNISSWKDLQKEIRIE